MAWQVKSQHVDKALGHHVVILHDPSINAGHVLQIIVGHESCPVCGHVKIAENVNELSPREIIAQEVANLEAAHAQSHEYARKHNIPVMGADGKAR